MPSPEDHLALSTLGAQAASIEKPGIRVTKELIDSKIADVSYIERDTLTIAIITMKNGFATFGISRCIDPATYDKDVGRRFAFDDGYEKLWPLEGYLLAELCYLRGIQQANDMMADLMAAPENHEVPDV